MSPGKSLLTGLVVGALIALFVRSAALDHNPQGEFADTVTGAYTSDLYNLFAAWMVVVGVPIAIFLSVIGWLLRRAD
ncbi:MAG TPA: hypothetical protein VLJ84_05860 [Usitatibacter sp.]|nr:hypothetical protein [Usitatibacter sp.]